MSAFALCQRPAHLHHQRWSFAFASAFASVFAAALATATPAANAQPSTRTPISNDARLMARAESLTIGDYCRAARAVITSTDIVQAMGARSAGVQLSANFICMPSLSTTPLIALRGDQPVSLKSVARIHPQDFVELHQRTLVAMKTFFAVVRADDMVPITKAALGDTMNTLLVRTTETVNSLLSAAARDSALVRLSHYERKLGPTSARLNVAEVFLNYGAQRFIPGFRPSPFTGPSPWEVVTSYVPTYGTIADKRAQAVSASEFGVRHYLFGDDFGASGWEGTLKPSYWSAGVLVVSDNNGALVWPWQDHQRTGAYVSWGAIKVGYVPGRNGQLLVSRQMHVIPFVF